MNFDISGAAIYLRIPTGIPVLGDFVITETMVVSWLVMILITGFCIWLTRDLRVENISKRQAVAEMLVAGHQSGPQQYRRYKVRLSDPLCGSPLYHKCGVKPDQPDGS